MPARAVLAHLDAEEGRHVGHARRLLHVVRDDHDRELLLQIVDQVLDARRRDRVEGGCRLVHQDHVRLHGDGPGDAQPLLLSAREAERVVLQPVLHLVPERRLPERPLDAAVEVGLHPEHPGAERDVVVDRLREGIRLLEDHPDPPPHLDRIDVRAVEVTAVVEHLPVDPGAGDQVVHPVEAADERRLATPGGPDERRHEVLANVERDVVEGDVPAVGDGEALDVEHGLAAAAVLCDGLCDLGDPRAVDLRCRHAHSPRSVPRGHARVGARLVNNW